MSFFDFDKLFPIKNLPYNHTPDSPTIIMSKTELTPGEKKLLSLVWQCFETAPKVRSITCDNRIITDRFPQVNMKKLATIGEYKTAASANVSANPPPPFAYKVRETQQQRVPRAKSEVLTPFPPLAFRHAGTTSRRNSSTRPTLPPHPHPHPHPRPPPPHRPKQPQSTSRPATSSS